MRLFFQYCLKFIALVFGTVFLYTLAISAYTRISPDPIIFFASLVIIAIIGLLEFFFIYHQTRSRANEIPSAIRQFLCAVTALACCMITTVYAVFGPVFIDRSISYHIAFYASENETVNIEEIEESFSTNIFEKRIHDAIAVGVIEDVGNGQYRPTLKAKLIYGILYPLGNLTGSNQTYQQMKKIS